MGASVSSSTTPQRQRAQNLKHLDFYGYGFTHTRPFSTVFPLSVPVPQMALLSPESSLIWHRVRHNDLPINAWPSGGIDQKGDQVFLTRARCGDGSTRIGKAASSSTLGCLIPFGPNELSVDTYEVLMGAAPGFELDVASWNRNGPPLHAVVAGLLPTGRPIFLGLARHYLRNEYNEVREVISPGNVVNGECFISHDGYVEKVLDFVVIVSTPITLLQHPLLHWPTTLQQEISELVLVSASCEKENNHLHRNERTQMYAQSQSYDSYSSTDTVIVSSVVACAFDGHWSGHHQNEPYNLGTNEMSTDSNKDGGGGGWGDGGGGGGDGGGGGGGDGGGGGGDGGGGGGDGGGGGGGGGGGD